MRAPTGGLPGPLTGFLDRARTARAARVLAAGGVAVLPTDTLYGFHCAASRLDAAERIRAAKGRGVNAGFILLACDLDMVDGLVSRWPARARETLRGIWPAPLTAILPASRAVPRGLSPRGTVAVRVPAREELRAIIRLLGEPAVSTSVNITGRRPMSRIAAIRARFPGFEAYLSLRGRPLGLPSTVVDFTGAAPRLVRAGAFPWAPEGGRRAPSFPPAARAARRVRGREARTGGASGSRWNRQSSKPSK